VLYAGVLTCFSFFAQSTQQNEVARTTALSRYRLKVCLPESIVRAALVERLSVDDLCRRCAVGADDKEEQDQTVREVTRVLAVDAFLASNMPPATLEIVCMVTDQDPFSSSDDENEDEENEDKDEEKEPTKKLKVCQDKERREYEEENEDEGETVMTVPWASGGLIACIRCGVSVSNRRQLWSCPTCCVRSCCATCASFIHLPHACANIAQLLEEALPNLAFSFAESL
jgi:hypothetical protein